MKIYLLDTNIISEPTRLNPNENVLQKLADNLEHSCISAVTWAEMLAGIKSLPEGKRKDGLFDYCIEYVQKQYEILSFDASAANIYSDLYERLKNADAKTQQRELMMASIAISNNLILVTQNISDFREIAENSNLMVEKW